MMKTNVKKVLLVFLSLICIFALTGCEDVEVTHETTEIQTTVVACDDGVLRLNAAYLATANLYLAQRNTAMYSMYYNMAITYGKKIYTVTVVIDGTGYTIEREEKFEPGSPITVIKECTFENGELVETEYK